MISIESLPHEWVNNTDVAMQNVNLSKIEFLNNRSICFTLLNSYDGKFLKNILCINVWKFSEENNLNKDDELPIFICDVNILKLKNDNIQDSFNYLGYSLSVPKSIDYYLLFMNSGELNIVLLCEKIEVK